MTVVDQVGDYDPHPFDRVWRMKRRPWWVCCYVPVDAHWNNHKKHWVIPIYDEWMDQRRLKVIMIKTFKTQEAAHESHSLRRLYAPFSNPASIVCLRYRAPTGIINITQYKLYGKKDGHS